MRQLIPLILLTITLTSCGYYHSEKEYKKLSNDYIECVENNNIWDKKFDSLFLEHEKLQKSFNNLKDLHRDLQFDYSMLRVRNEELREKCQK